MRQWTLRRFLFTGVGKLKKMAFVDLVAGDLGDDSPPGEDDDAVRHLDELVGFGGGEKHGSASGCHVAQRRVEVTTSPDVDPLGGLVEEEEATVGLQPAADDELLLIPA